MDEITGPVGPNNGSYNIPPISLTGPPLVGIVLNWGLFGVLSYQVYLYIQAFPNDRRTLKTLVYVVYVLEMAQTILVMGAAWQMYAVNFSIVEPSWLLVCILGGIVTSLVQIFYVYRIAILSQNRIISAFIVLFSVASLTGSLVSAVHTEQEDPMGEFIPVLGKLVTPIGVWIASGSACDILIVGSMCYYLHTRSQHSDFRKTQALIARVIRLTIETGALTASISIVTLVLYYSESTPGFFIAPVSILSKTYSTTMLAVLNSRVKFGILPTSAIWLDKELGMSSTHIREKEGDIMFRNKSTTTNVSLENLE